LEKEMPFMTPEHLRGKEEALDGAMENQKNTTGHTSRLAPFDVHS
jgi:hypothetical protein